MSEHHSATKTPPTMPEGFTVVDNDASSSTLANSKKDSSAVSRQGTSALKNNCIETSNECGIEGSVSPASSSSSFVDSTNDEEDGKSCASSGKDSGVGKSGSECANNSANSSWKQNSVCHNNFNTVSNRGEARESGGSSSQVELDSTFLWGASLLYYTGIPTPRIKEQYFITSPSPPPPSSPSPPTANSSFASTFSLFRSRSTAKLFRSSLSLRSSSSEAGMEEHHRRKSPWRFGGNSKKFNTLPIKTSSPLALESPNEVAGSSIAITTPDSGFLSGTGGESGGSGIHSSPLRRRHASCSSSTPTSSTSVMQAELLQGRIKNNTNSLRLLKNVTSRPSLSQFRDKSSSSNSLPRSPKKNRICEEIAAQQQVSVGESNPPASERKSSVGSSGLKSAKRALRNSFKAARSLLPGSSSKIGPATGKASPKSSRDKLCMFPSAFNGNDASALQNFSAPNTPVTTKKSRLERAKKRFASTLSLHTGGSSSSSNNEGSSTGAGRSKSVSTLVISDSEVIPGGIPSGVVSYTNHSRPQSQHNFAEESCHVLTERDDSVSENAEIAKSGSKSKGSRSPFRFISRSNKARNKETKSDAGPSGLQVPQDSQRQEEERGGKTVVISKEPSSPQASIELLPKSVQEKVLTAEADEQEKPNKKRMSLVKSIVGRAILRGGSNSAGRNSSKAEHYDDGNIQQKGKKETVMFYKTAAEGTLSDSETRRSRRGISESKESGSQEIVTFYNEPKVRTPKAGRRQRLHSGSGTSGSTASSSVTYTPPRSATEPIVSTPEKDREVHEVEVSETSIDISPVKKQHFLATSHYDTSKRGNPADSCNDYDRTTVTCQLSADRATNRNPLSSSSSASTPKKPSKKTKSSSLITSLVSLSPSSPLSMGKGMEDGSSNGKKKKKGFKKVNKKSNQDEKDSIATAATRQQSDQSTSSSPVKEDQFSENSKCIRRSIDNNNDADDPLSSTVRRRKSSEEFKELRKNAMCSNGNIFLDKEANVVSSRATEREHGKRAAMKEGEENDSVSVENNEVDETDDPDTACTESFRQLKPFNYDLEPVEEGKKERLYKVLVVGELGAGKTSIIKRYVHQFFSQHYRATIGVDFALKVLRWDPDTVVRLQLWDIAGQERFGSMTRVYYKEAVGAFVVFDVTRSATLEAVPKWKADLDAKVALPDGRPIPTVLLANKSDQPKEGIAANREKMNDFCQQQGFSAWFETSAKDNINIDESANFLVSKILEMDKWSQEPLVTDPDKVELTANGKHKGSASSNCAC